jgi:hypothetical protein
MRCVAYVAHIGEIRQLCKILAENLMRRDMMEDLDTDCKVRVSTLDPKGTRWDNADRIYLTLDRCWW